MVDRILQYLDEGNLPTTAGLNNSKKNQVAHRATYWQKSSCPYQEWGCPPLSSPIVNNKVYDDLWPIAK